MFLPVCSSLHEITPSPLQLHHPISLLLANLPLAPSPILPLANTLSAFLSSFLLSPPSLGVYGRCKHERPGRTHITRLHRYVTLQYSTLLDLCPKILSYDMYSIYIVLLCLTLLPPVMSQSILYILTVFIIIEDILCLLLSSHFLNQPSLSTHIPYISTHTY